MENCHESFENLYYGLDILSCVDLLMGDPTIYMNRALSGDPSSTLTPVCIERECTEAILTQSTIVYCVLFLRRMLRVCAEYSTNPYLVQGAEEL